MNGEIGPQTRVVGIFGHPVSHSMSPAMHGAAFRKLGLDFVYLPFDVLPLRVGEAVSAIRALGLRGVNVTIPHKEAVIPFLDALSPEARMIGAVNTIVLEEGVLTGHNTDGLGFIRSLEAEAGTGPLGKTIVLIGAGGACRALALTLAARGAKALIIVNRTLARAQAVAAEVNSLTGVPVQPMDLGSPSMEDTLKDAHILINTSPVGMYPNHDVQPVVPEEFLIPGLLVCDLVYNPARTALLQAASRRGCPTLGGLGMLVYQGAESFKLWTGVEAPVDVMRVAVEVHLANRKLEVRG
ncbi:MAG: shikimate dehydrogenase [Bacillota bacterium]